MHKLATLFSAAAVIVVTSVASAQTVPKILTPSNLHWSTAQMPKGSTAAVLAGDPNGTSYFDLRIKMSPGTTFAPHTHKATEILSVVSGTLYVGFGKTVDKDKAQAVQPGSVVVIPAGVAHYTFAKGNVVYDVSGMGPSKNIPVNGTM
jgi:quercetin dioxygenase-like cupin family protein